MKISIVGQITDTKCEGCFSPIDLKEQLEGVDANEPLEVEITSEGGSVFAGIQIANILSRHNGKVTTHAVGLCASIATVILMAGEKVVVDDNCFCLIHLPWSYCEGNANDMLKEIDTLKKCENAMMGYYRKHSKVDDETLSRYINDETWFLGSEFAQVFNVEVLECDQVMNIAARFDLNKFNKVDKRISIMDEDKKKRTTTEEVVEETPAEETPNETSECGESSGDSTPSGEVQKEEVVDDPCEKKDETPDEDVEEQDDDEDELAKANATIAELQAKIAELEAKLAQYDEDDEDDEDEDEEMDMVSNEECEKRVSGMQASMQKQVNDFANQLKARDEELTEAKASIISLNTKLEQAKSELSEMASALEEKANALAQLNAGVLKPSEELPTMNEGLAKCATPEEKVAFLKSGKYVR